ncbi:MAG: S9 family peptidase [Acidobacteria bacterium]|nr:S9 family peptidase [Acidobacteriota bacterium]
MRILISFALAVALYAQAPNSKQSLSMQRPLDAVISPDGSTVVYVLSRTNWEDNASESDLYLANIASGQNLKLTASRKSSSSPVWSPDSKRIAFLSNRDGKQQIYVMPIGNGEAIQLTNHETGVNMMDWVVPGEIHFTAGEPETAAMKERKQKYGDLAVVEDDYTLSHVWRVKVSDTPKQKAEQLTSGAYHVSYFAISPDGKTLAMVTKKNPDLSTLGSSLEIVEVASKSKRTLAESRNNFGGIRWSPDSKQIAYTTQGETPYTSYANSYVEVRSITDGPARKVSGDVDEQPMIVDWTSRGIFFMARKKTAMAPYVADPSGGGVRELAIDPNWMLTQVSLSKDLRAAAFIGARSGENYEIYTTAVSSWSPTALTQLKQQWASFKPARREVISWKSKDGATIEGVLYKPVDFDPKRKYPLLVVIHGGPTGIDVPYITPDSYYPAEQFVAKGALVLRPNYRGSAGYGAKFRALNVGNLGVGDAWDVLSGIDHLVNLGHVDASRVGSMGWSQGGYISAFLATAHADRFKALSVGAGISNWVTYYVNTDIHPFTRTYLKATPWDDMEIYRKTSPMTYIKQAKAPVLIQHGDNDKRVPPPNAFELYQGLKDVGVPARLVLYKGFGHGINKPKEAMHVMDENLSWFSRHVFGESN